DPDGDHAAHLDAQVADGAAAIQAGDAALEVDLVAHVVARVVGACVPVYEQCRHRRDEQHEGADGGVVSLTLHVTRLPAVRSALPALRGNRPGSTDVGWR